MPILNTENLRSHRSPLIIFHYISPFPFHRKQQNNFTSPLIFFIGGVASVRTQIRFILRFAINLLPRSAEVMVKNYTDAGAIPSTALFQDIQHTPGWRRWMWKVLVVASQVAAYYCFMEGKGEECFRVLCMQLYELHIFTFILHLHSLSLNIIIINV